MVTHRGHVAIEVSGLTKVFRGPGGRDIVANDDLSFSVPRGQVFGLLGANGAGKTTLVMQLLGLLRPTAGSIRVEGVDVVAAPEQVSYICGFLPQTPLSMGLIEVRRALHYTGRLRGQSQPEALRQTDELIAELGLASFADRYVDKLSGGMKRLANIGMALMGRPKVLVLDEPTNELDPQNRRMVWDAIARRSANEGTTIILVTHNVLEAEKTVHRVAVMQQSRIVALGTPGELKAKIGSSARLDLVLKDGDSLSPAELERLGHAGRVEAGRRAGTYHVHAEQERIGDLTALVTGQVGLARLDDFRLARPSLEDVYLSMDDRGAAAPAAKSPAPVAPAPRPAPRAVLPLGDRLHRFGVALKYLWFEQMLEVRTTWTWSLLLGLLMPVAMVFGLARIGSGLADRPSLLFIISGAAVFSCATEGIATLAQRIGFTKKNGMMLYYASLPISKASFVSAIALSRLVVIIPGLIAPIVAGRLMYGVDLHISPLLLVVLPLTCLSLAGVGLALGSLIDSMDLIFMITNLLVFVLLLAAPVLIPPESLPAPLRIFGYLLPPTYAADALRRSLDGGYSLPLVLDLGVLAALAALSLYASSRWLRWRTN